MSWLVGDAGLGQPPLSIRGFGPLTMDAAVDYSTELLTAGHLDKETVFGQSLAPLDAVVLPGNRELVDKQAPGVATSYVPGTWRTQFGPGVEPAGDIRVKGEWSVSRKTFNGTPNLSLLWKGAFAYPVTYEGVETMVVVRRSLRANWVDDPDGYPGLDVNASFVNVDPCTSKTERRWYFPYLKNTTAEDFEEVIADPTGVKNRRSSAKDLAEQCSSS